MLAVAAAMATRSGADQVVRGTFGFVVVPLLAYGAVTATLGGHGLRASVRPLVVLGADAGRAALAAVLASAVLAALACAAVGAVVCVLAHRAGDPPLLQDVVATAGISLLAGAAYAAYFCAGSAIGKGAMRGAFLAIDWLVGSQGGFGSLFTPRGHLTSLLGGAQAFELPARTSSIVLVGLTLLYTIAAVRLGRR
ncbi:MAG: hypothetical protein KIT84_12660 [Labilithrix sp.]|nr:hypothetical protein [Labilithrix sp.]MCW5811866.1 hypothetical protein [Labilithrix sp.]